MEEQLLIPTQSMSVITLRGGRSIVSVTMLTAHFNVFLAHINNLYNTTFWAIVQQGGKTEREAHKILQGTVSAEKHDILFKEYGINYNTLDDLYKKGSILVRIPPPMPEIPADGSYKDKKKIEKIRKDGIDGTRGPIEILHLDIIKDTFWNDRPWLLSQLD